jgi:YesN/AraC family two-component response regulator
MIVTGAAEPEVLEAAFAAGASDYVVKPVMMVELLARARSLLRLKKEIDTRRSRELELEDTIAKLQEALVEVKRLSGLLPICAHCKKIRNDAGYWQQVEIYLGEHSDARFSHGICPDCLRQRHPQYADRVLERVRQKETG